MNKRFLLWDNPRQAIFTLMAVLLLLGGINVFSASLYDNGLSYLLRYYLCAVLGFVGIYFIRKIGYKRLLNKRFLWICYCIVLVMLVVVHFWGAANKGATRWIYMGSFSIQPSEIAKLVLIMLSARFLGNAMKLGEKISLYKGECLLVTMAAGIAAFGVLVQPDLGTAAIIAALVMGMFIVAGLSARWITTIVGVGAVGAVLLSISSEYRLQRLHVWFDPWLDPQGKGDWGGRSYRHQLGTRCSKVRLFAGGSYRLCFCCFLSGKRLFRSAYSAACFLSAGSCFL